MKKTFLLFLTAFSLTLLSLLSCQKTETATANNEASKSPFAVKEAKAWYENSLTGNATSSKTNGNAKIKNFTPLWEQGKTSEDETYYVVECPTKFEKTPGFLIQHSSSSADTNNVKGKTKLLVLKNKKTGKILSALMHVVSETSSGGEISYRPKNSQLTGYIFFTDLDGEFVNGWKYKNGEIIAKGSKKAAQLINGKALPPDDPHNNSCWTVVTNWYERDCIEYYNGDYQCGNWNYMYSTSETYCPPSSGGTGSGGTGGYEEPSWDNGTSIGKLCANYTFATVGNSFTATVNNLRWNYRSPQGIQYPIIYPQTCLSIPNYNVNHAQASIAFNEAFNAAANQVLDELDAGLLSPMGIQVRLKNLTQGNLANLIPGSTWSAIGACAGFIPVNTLGSSSYCP